MKLTSRFRILLAEKEVREGTSYTMIDIARETGVSIYTVTAFANNTLKEIPVDALLKICAFLECSAGELLQTTQNGPRNGQTTALAAA